MKAIDWLLSGESWIQYQTRLDLLEEKIDEIDKNLYREEIRKDKLVNDLISDVKEWSTTIMKNHKDAKHPIHKLSFLADIGLDIHCKEIEEILNEIYKYKNDKGIYQILSNIPTHFGGSGKDEYSWILCDAPLVLYSVVKFDSTKIDEVIEATKYLCSIQDENGWHCKASDKLGKFRGPGKKADPCPYANLLMLKLIAELNAKLNAKLNTELNAKLNTELNTELNAKLFEKEALNGINAILELWDHRKERKEYLFGMGTDFAKVKAPLIWFDILHVLDVLSNFEIVHEDRRFLEMVEILKEKLIDNKMKPESIYMHWKEWEFSKKKEESRWLTFITYRILKRIEQ